MDRIKEVDKVYGVSKGHNRIRKTISYGLSVHITGAFILYFLSIISAIYDHFKQTYLGTTNVHFVELSLKYSF